MSVHIRTEGGRFDVGKIEPLFQAREVWARGSGTRYDVSSDGERFLIFAPATEDAPSTISLWLNWNEEVNTR